MAFALLFGCRDDEKTIFWRKGSFPYCALSAVSAFYPHA
jgi:hypothetical protein